MGLPARRRSATLSVVRRVAYVTDIEGQWDKLASFCARSPSVKLDPEDRLSVADDAVLVFGGDAIDRGPHGRRIVSTLLAAKRAAPDRVVLLAGNRDINKLRLVRELAGHPPARAPVETTLAGPGALLSFIFSHTMGARDALDHRRTEITREGRPASDDDVAQSFLEDLAPDGELTRYLAACQLAHREETTLFVHGGVTAENFGAIPGIRERAETVDVWIDRLNAFYESSLEAFVARRIHIDGSAGWSTLVDYQAPVRGTRLNQQSVVYARPTNERGDPVLPPRDIVDRLARADIERVVVGHTPAGDCPTILRDERGFELIMADNSYGRIERGPHVQIDARGLRIEGETELDTGAREEVSFDLAPRQRCPLGRRDDASGLLVKARLANGHYLGYRVVEGYRVEQRAVDERYLATRRLVAPEA